MVFLICKFALELFDCQTVAACIALLLSKVIFSWLLVMSWRYASDVNIRYLRSKIHLINYMIRMSSLLFPDNFFNLVPLVLEQVKITRLCPQNALFRLLLICFVDM